MTTEQPTVAPAAERTTDLTTTTAETTDNTSILDLVYSVEIYDADELLYVYFVALGSVIVGGALVFMLLRLLKRSAY